MAIVGHIVVNNTDLNLNSGLKFSQAIARGFLFGASERLKLSSTMVHSPARMKISGLSRVIQPVAMHNSVWPSPHPLAILVVNPQRPC